MGVVNTLLRKTSRGRARLEAARIGAWVRDDPDAGLLQLIRFVEEIDESAPSIDQRILALDLLSAVLRDASVRTATALRARPLPLQPEDLSRLHRFFRGCRVVRDALRRVYGAVLTPEAPEAGSAAALTVLSHALALQSLLLSTACQVRVGLARDDWDELCRLAWPVWRANQLDTPPRQRKEGSTLTARAVLIEPLLLRLLEPLGLSPLEFDLALDEARRAARVVGIRIDEDAVLHASPEGPVMMLSADYSVQLDTRASTHDLRMRLAMINHGAALSEAGVQATLARPQVRSVMERLAEVWGAGSMPRPLMRPPLPRALVHWGLPAPWLLSAPAADTAQDDPMIDALAAQSETLVWRGSDARRAVFTRSVPTPRLCLGQLVTLLPWRVHEGRVMRPVQRVGNEPHGLMMGRIVTLTHTGSPHSRQPFAHDVGVVFWAGTPQRVLFRRAGQSELAEGWCFAGNAQEPPCLIIPRDAFEGPSDIRGVLGGRELTLSCLRLLERGIDFDRVELAPLEPPLV